MTKGRPSSRAGRAAKLLAAIGCTIAIAMSGATSCDAGDDYVCCAPNGPPGSVICECFIGTCGGLIEVEACDAPASGECCSFPHQEQGNCACVRDPTEVPCGNLGHGTSFDVVADCTEEP